MTFSLKNGMFARGSGVGISLLLFTWCWIGSAFADESWLFYRHPVPSWEETTIAELRALPRREVGGPCEQELTDYWEIYAGRYPEFAERFSAERGKRLLLPQILKVNEWTTSTASLASCALKERIAMLLRRYEARTGAMPCSLRLPDPERGRELEAHFAIYRELVASRNPAAVRSSFMFGLIETFEPNPDILYFVELATISVHPELGPSIYRSWLEPERRRFVEAAFARNDLDAVLDTTKPCSAA